MSVTRVLLICGVVGTIVYIAMDIAAATLFYPGYDYTAQQVSELSAIGAPSRPFWLAMSWLNAVLTTAFGIGVWLVANGRPSLRIAAALIVLFAVSGLAWVHFAPMHMRGTEFTATDTAHIGFTIGTVVTMLAFIAAGAIALGRRFRIYSALTVVAMLAAGAVVGTQVSAIAAGEPTPWMGLVERSSVYSPMVWMAVFAVALRADAEAPTRGGTGQTSRAGINHACQLSLRDQSGVTGASRWGSLIFGQAKGDSRAMIVDDDFRGRTGRGRSAGRLSRPLLASAAGLARWRWPGAPAGP